MTDDDVRPCSYPGHRGSYWRLVGTIAEQCGICHPPADGLPAVNSRTGMELPPECFASRHQVRSHLTLAASPSTTEDP